MNINKEIISNFKLSNLSENFFTKQKELLFKEKDLLIAKAYDLIEKSEEELNNENYYILSNILKYLKRVEDFRAVELSIKIQEKFYCLDFIFDDASWVIEHFAKEKHFDDLYDLWNKLQEGSEEKETILNALCSTGKIDLKVRENSVFSLKNSQNFELVAYAMADSGDEYYIPFLEEVLENVSFIIKYIDLTSFEFRLSKEGRYWIEAGYAWLRLKSKKGDDLDDSRDIQGVLNASKKNQQVVNDYFLSKLPDTLDEWLSSPDVEDEKKIIFKDKLSSYHKRKKESMQFPVEKTKKVSRNDPCPCGSRKKYKKCCLR